VLQFPGVVEMLDIENREPEIKDAFKKRLAALKI